MVDLDDPRFGARVRYILEHSVATMPDAERDARIRHCQQTGEHGIRSFRESDGTVRFEWGGALLAVVEPDVFSDDGYLTDLTVEQLREFPDDVRGLELPDGLE